MASASGSTSADASYVDGPRQGHIAYTAVSLISMALISTLFGLRLKSFGFNSIAGLKALTPIRFIVAGIYICGIALMFCLGIMLSGVGLNDYSMCRLGIYLCYLFYVCGNKVLMYLFMVERAHLVRAHTHRRSRDGFWWAGMTIILLGFGSITTFAYVGEAWVKSSSRGCMMGLPASLLIPLLVYDIGINTLLTLLFVYFLLRQLRFRGGLRVEKCPICRTLHKLLGYGDCSHMGSLENRPLQSASTGTFTAQLESLIKRSLVAALLLMVPTAINLAVLLKYHGYEQGWACFTGCSLDVTLSVIVVHWLTTPDASTTRLQRPGLNRNATSGATSGAKSESSKTSGASCQTV